MSADNQMVVDYKNGKWRCYMICCSSDNILGEIEYFDEELDAIHRAGDICQEEIVEYGVSILRK